MNSNHLPLLIFLLLSTLFQRRSGVYRFDSRGVWGTIGGEVKKNPLSLTVAITPCTNQLIFTLAGLAINFGWCTGLAEISAYFRLSRKFCGGGGGLTKIRRLSRGLFSVYVHSHIGLMSGIHIKEGILVI